MSELSAADFWAFVAAFVKADWWSLFTTLVGAVIGAAVSYLIARQAAKETREAQREERLIQERSVAQALTVKLMRLLNSLAGYDQRTEDSIREAEKQIPDAMLWQKLLPIVATEESLIRVEPSEWAILVAAKEFDLLNRAIMLTDRYNGLVHSYRTYSIERVKLTDQFSAIMDGKIGTTLLTQEGKERLEPRAVALEDHANGVRSSIKEVLSEALDLLPKLGPVFRVYFKDPTFPILALTDSTSTDDTTKTP